MYADTRVYTMIKNLGVGTAPNHLTAAYLLRSAKSVFEKNEAKLTNFYHTKILPHPKLAEFFELAISFRLS